MSAVWAFGLAAEVVDEGAAEETEGGEDEFFGEGAGSVAGAAAPEEVAPEEMHGALGEAALGVDAGEGCDDAVEHGGRGEVLLPGLAGEAAAGFALGEVGLEDGGELFDLALGDAEEEGIPGGATVGSGPMTRPLAKVPNLRSRDQCHVRSRRRSHT